MSKILKYILGLLLISNTSFGTIYTNNSAIIWTGTNYFLNTVELSSNLVVSGRFGLGATAPTGIVNRVVIASGELAPLLQAQAVLTVYGTNGNGNVVTSIIAETNKAAKLCFGKPLVPYLGALSYDNATDTLTILASNVVGLTINTAGSTFATNLTVGGSITANGTVNGVTMANVLTNGDTREVGISNSLTVAGQQTNGGSIYMSGNIKFSGTTTLDGGGQININPANTRYVEMNVSGGGGFRVLGGNVGINTNTPVERLHVMGNVQIESNLWTKGKLLLGNNVTIPYGVTNYYLRPDGGTNSIFVQTNGYLQIYAGTSPALTISTNAGVGIGSTINPTGGRIDGGNMYMSGTAYLNDIQSSSGRGVISVQNQSNVTIGSSVNGIYYLSSSNGFVGLATNNPQERLHVNGNVLVQSNLTVNGTINGLTTSMILTNPAITNGFIGLATAASLTNGLAGTNYISGGSDASMYFNTVGGIITGGANYTISINNIVSNGSRIATVVNNVFTNLLIGSYILNTSSYQYGPTWPSGTPKYMGLQVFVKSTNDVICGNATRIGNSYRIHIIPMGGQGTDNIFTHQMFLRVVSNNASFYATYITSGSDIGIFTNTISYGSLIYLGSN